MTRVAKRLEEERPMLVIDRALTCLGPKYQGTIIAVSAHIVFADRIVDGQKKCFLNYLCMHKSFSGSLDPVETANAFAAFYAGALRTV